MSGQVVQITINVTDANAAEAVQQVVAQLNALGPAGEAAGAKAGAGLDQIGEHAISSREQVRLMSEDLGIRVPRAMQSVIANSQLMSGAIGAMGPALIGLGAVDIFAHLGESAYNLYEKYIDINAAQRDMLKTMEEAKDKDFINVHSLETARLRIDEATSAMINLHNAAESGSKGGWVDLLTGLGNPGAMGVGVSELLTARNMSGASAKAAGQTQELSPQEQSLLHQQNMAQIDADHAGDARLGKEAKITAELQKQLDINKEKQRYTAIEEGERGNIHAHDAGKGMEGIEDAAARAKAHADEMEFQRQERDQTIQRQNEAINAGLEGNALRHAQEEQAIDAITRKVQDGEISKQAAIRDTAAVQNKFAMEALKLQAELDAQTRHLADEAAQAGLKGSPLIEAQLKTQLAAIDEAERKVVGLGGTETPEQSADFSSQRQSAQQISNQKKIESQQQFTDQIRALTESSNNFETEGYARIEAETRTHLETLSKDYEAQYGADEGKWAGYQATKAQIMADADKEMERLHQKTMEEITKEEEQAARLSLPEWQQALAAIEDEYADRVRKIQQDVRQHVMSEQEGASATVAAWQVANAQIQRSDEETRDKIASGLQSMFSNPAQFFEKRAMDTGFQMMANEMLSVFKSSSPTGGILQYMFGMGPQMSTSSDPLDAMKSALGMGGHGTAGLSTAASPGAMQFQQSTSTFSLSATTFASAVTQFASAASMMSVGGKMGGGGLGILGLGGGGGAASGIGGGGGGSDFGSDFSSGGDANAMMMPGLGPSMSAASASSTFDNSMMMPGLNGVAADSTLGNLGGAASTGAKGFGAAAGIAGGALMAGTSIFSAFQNSNPIAGAMGGAMGGMELGASLGSVIPGLGTVIGGAIGAIAGGVGGLLAGIFGDKGRGQAEGLDVNTIQPTLTKDMQDYEAGRAGYNTLAAELNSMEISAQNQTQQMGSGARSYFNSNIQPEIQAVLSSLQKQEIGGRSQISLTAGQYHGGGLIDGFGDLATSSTEGFIHAMQNEFVVNPMAAAAHAPILQAMNSGTNFGYSSTVQPRMPAGAAGSGATINIQAIDSKSFAQWAQSGGGLMLMSAMNQANRQYSGVGRG